VGCASGPELEKYPRTQIDRPYTLPKGVANWQIPTIMGLISDNSGSIFIPPIPVPLIWQSSITDDWTLNWTPLPMSVSHQFSHTKEQVFGTTFGLGGFSWSSTSGIIIMPQIALYHRYAFSPTFALETTPSFSSTYKTSSRLLTWAIGLKVGPLVQLSEKFALKASVEANYNYGYQFLSLGDSSVSPGLSYLFTLPLSLGFRWSIHRQWDMDGTYNFSSIGYSNGFQAHTFLLHFTHFW
jgi:hypothetical protein